MTGAAEIDCLVIGGGPAGLTATIYLARYRRTVLVADGGKSRAALWFFSNYRTARDGKAEPRYAVAARGNDRKLRRLRRQRERISTM